MRLPADLVIKLGLSEGDDIELTALGQHVFGVERSLTLDERFSLLRQARGAVDHGTVFDRNETHDR